MFVMKAIRTWAISLLLVIGSKELPESDQLLYLDFILRFFFFTLEDS